MNYYQFQKTLIEEVRHQAGDGKGIHMRRIEKNNGILRYALEITDETPGMYPSIYMEPYYSRYQEGVPVSKLAGLVLEECEAYHTRKVIPDNFFSDFDEIADDLYCKLINYEKNKENLLEVPHERWCDLAIVCYYRVDPAVLPDASILIKNEILENWDVTEQILMETAWLNTLCDSTLVLKPLSAVLKEMNVYVPDENTDSPLYMLTNDDKTFGSVMITEPLTLIRAAETMKGDYYILPSSIHECLLLPAAAAENEELLIRMVREINRTQVAPQEVLSDNIYYYDSEKMKIRVCRLPEDDRAEADGI